jgi:hypothetical protein
MDVVLKSVALATPRATVSAVGMRKDRYSH